MISKKISQWLLPTVLILFILEVLTLPLVLEFTYAGRSNGPDHILTYKTGSLVWDSATGIDEHGVAKLSLFDTLYGDTVDGNGDKVVAPGTEGMNILRLKNAGETEISYTAVLYCIKTNPALPVKVSLQGTKFTDTTSYQLPYEISDQDVLRAVTGKLPSGQIQDFDISWLWDYETSEQQNAIDTALGNWDEMDNITVGVYLLVEDGGIIVEPEPPKTGDEGLGMYFTLMGISLVALILLVWDQHNQRKHNQ